MTDFLPPAPPIPPPPPGSAATTDMTMVDRRIALHIDPLKVAINRLANAEHAQRSQIGDMLDKLDSLLAPSPSPEPMRIEDTVPPPRKRGILTWGCLGVAMLMLLVSLCLAGYFIWAWIGQFRSDNSDPLIDVGQVAEAAARAAELQTTGWSQLYQDAGNRALAGEFEDLTGVSEFMRANKDSISAKSAEQVRPLIEKFAGESFTADGVGKLLIEIGKGWK